VALNSKILDRNHILSVEKVRDLSTVESQLNTTERMTRTELNKFHQSYGFKINPSLDEEKCYQILKLLHKYKSVFMRDVTDIKACKGPPLKLDVHTNRKTFQRQYRLSDTDKVEDKPNVRCQGH